MFGSAPINFIRRDANGVSFRAGRVKLANRLSHHDIIPDWQIVE